MNNKINRYQSFRMLFHVMIVSVIVLLPFVIFPLGIETYYITRVRVTLLVASPFYFLNVFVFIPQLLKKGKFLGYVVVLVLCVLFSVYLNGVLIENPVPEKRILLYNYFPRPMSVFPMVVFLALGTSFEMILEWEKQKRMKEAVEKEKVLAELSFLKSQVNPHFLFNSLNNIYALAESGSKLTVKAVLLLADIMRYMLYESNGDWVMLKAESQYLQNYIDLQKLRISNRKHIDIQFTMQGDIDRVMVAPMVFLPFVENAFKHGISYHQPSYVRICLLMEKDNVSFSVANSRHAQPMGGNVLNEERASGLGLANIRRRLALLYPNTHHLAIEETATAYQATLKITPRYD